MSVLLTLAPVCTLIFFWAITAAIGEGLFALLYTESGRDFSNSGRILARAFEATVVIIIISGAGMIILGGVGWFTEIANG